VIRFYSSLVPRLPSLTCLNLAISLLPACGPGVPFGKVAFGAIQAEGVVDLDYLKAELLTLEPELEACYARGLRRNHGSEGTVFLSMQGGTGHLSPTVVRNTTGDAQLADCVTERIARVALVERGDGPWRFTADWSVEFHIARRKPSNV